MEFTNALLIFYIIMVANFFENFFSCDLQRLFRSNIVAKHVLAIISAFFLITIVEEKGANSLWDMFKTTLYIYALYILSTKSKAMFVLPMLVLLFIDQVIKIQIDIYDKKVNDEAKANAEAKEGFVGEAQQIEKLQKMRVALKNVIILIIVAGAVHYFIRAKRQFGKGFSYVKFFAGTVKCSHVKD